jgi:putative ABC transport system ATP-binding protein
MEQATHLYELRKVTKEFSRASIKVRALTEIDLAIEAGDFVALVGPSGSGKSTLLQLLGALETPSTGRIFFKGQDLSLLGDRALTALRAHEIGFVFQSFNLIPTLTALDNVLAAMVPSGIDRALRRERALELLTRVGLEDRTAHLPSRLSGGEQQRVAIARALANRPSVVIADEPTGNLDSAMSEDIMTILEEIRDTGGITITLATHDPKIAERTERRITLRDGRIDSDA